MFKIAFACVLMGFSLQGFSQQDDIPTEKRSSYGFNVGLNYSNLIAPDGLPNNASISNNLGFRMGILADYKLNRIISFSPKAELSFYNSAVDFKEAQGVESSYAVMPVDVEVMTHFVFKKKGVKASPYFLVGPNLRIPLDKSGESPTDFGTAWDVAIDLGIGLDKTFAHFKLAPELRYSYGLLNVNQNPQLKSLHFHNVSLVFNFRG